MPTPAPAMPPLPQDVEQFLTWMTDQKGFSPATISAYRTDLLQFEEWLHREQHSLARPGELEKYHFQDYSAHLFHEGQARSSIGRKLSALRSLFRYLMKMKKIDKNPAKLVRNPKRELRHPTALNVDQMFTLLDEASVESGGAAGLDGSRQAEQAVTDREHARHTRDLALAELLYGSGLRISEALDLDVDDVDPASGFIRVIGKGSKERIAPLSDTSVRALFLWLRVRALIAPPAEKALFVGNRGKRRGFSTRSEKAPDCRNICRRTPCVTPSPRTCWRTARICAPCRNCSAMPAFPPPSATRTSPLIILCASTTRRIPAQAFGGKAGRKGRMSDVGEGTLLQKGPLPRISPSQDFRPYRIPVASFPGLFININILLPINKK